MTENVILSDPPLKNGNTRFTTIPSKTYLIYNVEEIYCHLTLILPICFPAVKMLNHFVEKPKLK